MVVCLLLLALGCLISQGHLYGSASTQPSDRTSVANPHYEAAVHQITLAENEMTLRPLATDAEKSAQKITDMMVGHVKQEVENEVLGARLASILRQYAQKDYRGDRVTDTRKTLRILLPAEDAFLIDTTVRDMALVDQAQYAIRKYDETVAEIRTLRDHTAEQFR
jgi:hypothetical protein